MAKKTTLRVGATLAVGVSLGAMAVSAPALAQSYDATWKQCQSASAPAAVAACSRLLDAFKMSAKGRAKALINRAISHGKQRAYQKAVADYDAAIRLDPKNAAAYNGKAWAYYQWARPGLGFAPVTKAIALNPRYARAYDTRGHLYRVMGQKMLAAHDFRTALSLSRDPAVVRSATFGLRSLGLGK